MCHLPLPAACITTLGEMQAVQSRSCRYLPAQTTWSSALALLQPSPPTVPAPHSQVSPASAPHPLYEKALSVPPVRARQFQKKNPIQKGVITQLLSALLSFPVMYGQIRRISHTGREQLEPLGRIFSRTLLPLLLACVHPCTKQAA